MIRWPWSRKQAAPVVAVVPADGEPVVTAVWAIELDATDRPVVFKKNGQPVLYVDASGITIPEHGPRLPMYLGGIGRA